MARSPIQQQIQEVHQAIQMYPKYKELLLFQKIILEILSTDVASKMESMTEILRDEGINDLIQKAVVSKRPMISFLNVNIFDFDGVLRVIKKVLGQMILRYSEIHVELEGLLKALENYEIDTKKVVTAIMGEDVSWFQRLSEIYNLEPSLLLFIFDTPLRPFFEELARRVEKDIIEKWWEPFCPVCGRVTAVARMRQRKRYMVCTYCGAKYLVDLFLCVNCDNKDPSTMGFIEFEEHPEYELNYCEKCKHYIKVLHDDRLDGKVSQGLEDLLTRELDARSREFGLKRA